MVTMSDAFTNALYTAPMIIDQPQDQPRVNRRDDKESKKKNADGGGGSDGIDDPSQRRRQNLHFRSRCLSKLIYSWLILSCGCKLDGIILQMEMKLQTSQKQKECPPIDNFNMWRENASDELEEYLSTLH